MMDFFCGFKAKSPKFEKISAPRKLSAYIYPRTYYRNLFVVCRYWRLWNTFLYRIVTSWKIAN